MLLEHLALSKDMEVELQIRIGLAAVLTSLQISLGTERVRCHFPLPHFRTAGECLRISVGFKKKISVKTPSK